MRLEPASGGHSSGRVPVCVGCDGRFLTGVSLFHRTRTRVSPLWDADFVSAPDITTEIIEQFRDSGAQAHSTILLGAGASTGSGLPDWDTLATRLLLDSSSVRDVKTASLLVKRQDPMLVVEAARVASGEAWPQLLRTALYAGIDSPEPSPLHLAAVGHLVDGDGNDTSLATLNFDTLLELAVEEETGNQAFASTDGLKRAHRYTVHHLHGVIRPHSSDSVVLTLSDFTALIANEESWQLNYLKNAVARGAQSASNPYFCRITQTPRRSSVSCAIST